jgi:hypothetical protein
MFGIIVKDKENSIFKGLKYIRRVLRTKLRNEGFELCENVFNRSKTQRINLGSIWISRG